jgi:poly(3-hydroxybutyrate) depolymerase
VAASDIRTIVFHGDKDGTVNPVNGEQVLAQFGAAGGRDRDVTQGRTPDGTAFTRIVESSSEGRPMLEHWLIHGAGHAWSGGSQSGSYTDPRGPDASREMLRFFLQAEAGQPSGS